MLATVVALAAVSPAHASSIFFLRDSNIWVANPDGSGAKQVTTDGTSAVPYDFVSSAKTGTAPPLAFYRGGNSAGQFGTLNPDGTGNTVNPHNADMSAFNSFFTRLDDAGDRVTWADESDCCGFRDWYAGAVGVDGSSPQLIYFDPYSTTMDARDVTFGDPRGSSLLFTDVGTNYTVGAANDAPCGGTDNLSDVLVLETPPPSGQTTGPGPTAVYCQDNVFFETPALRPDGQVIAAEADPASAGSSGGLVTMAIGAGVASGSGQTPATQVTPPDSGDTLPDFSPDGTQIVFQRGTSTIWTVPAGGGAPSEILSDASTPAWSPYTLPAAGGGGGGTVGGGGTGGGGTGSGGTGGGHLDEVHSVGLGQRTVGSGRPVTIEVRLRARSRIVVAILRLVPASGHGRHRHRAHYRLVGKVKFAGTQGLNRLRMTRVHRHSLAPGGYEARVSAGGRGHVVKFRVRR